MTTEIIIKGNEELDVKIKLIPGKKTYGKRITIINKLWNRAKKKNSCLFNGKAYSLLKYYLENNNLTLIIQQTDYKAFVGTNLSLNQDRLEKVTLANILAVSALTFTKDEKILLGLRSHEVAEASDMWHIPGGNVDAYSGNNTLLASIKKELWQECSINEKDIAAINFLGLIINKLNNKPEAIFKIKLSINSQKLKEKISNSID